MRKIITGDVFKMSRIIKAANIKQPLMDVLSGSQTDTDKGLLFIMTLMDACADEEAEKLLYDFLGGIMEITPTKIKELPLDELLENFKEIAKENNLLSFFRIASKSA